MMRALMILALLCLGMGCLEDFDGQERILGPRTIGARAIVTDQPGEAWPAPGEEVTVEFYTVDFAEPVPRTWALIACPAVLLPTGDKFCGAAPFGVAQIDVATLEPPTVAGVVPMDIAAEEMLVLGAICVDGTPNVNLEEFDITCEGPDAVRELVQFTIPISQGETNMHPLPGGFLIDGTPWDATGEGLPAIGCAGNTEIPSFAFSEDPVVMTIVPDEASREAFVVEDMEMREELLYTPHITLDFGSFERATTIVDGQEGPIEHEWEFGDDATVIDPAGELARVFFVVRDQRSGMSWAQRAFCVTP